MNTPSAIVASRLSATTRHRAAVWRHWGCRVALAFLLLVGSDAVMAVSCSTGSSGSITVATNGSLNVPRDLPVGSWLHEWTGYVQDNPKWQCSGMLTNGWYGPIARMDLGTVVPGIEPEGYMVYATSLPGVGVAVEWAAVLGGSTYGGYSGLKFGTYEPDADVNGPTSTNFGFRFRVRLVKTAPIQTGGVVTLDGLQASVVMSEKTTATSTRTQIANSTVTVTFPSNKWTINTLTCTTQDMTVPMGDHRKTDFSGMGSRVGARDFDIAVNNCPAGISSIQYSLSPMNGVVDAAQGVIALSAGSGSATGVGIQITERDGVTPVPVAPDQAAKRLVPGSTTAGGSFTIPLRAAYYQSASTVTGGTADAQVELIMSYE